jgi:hypothetical protein
MASESENAGPKQTRGRFKPGQSGNPGGKAPGTRHRVTQMVEAMIEGEAEQLTQTAIRLAKAGDPALLKALLDRLAPPRKERPVQVALPPLQSPQDAPAIAARLIEAASAGELAPGEAQGIAGLLESYRRQSELACIEARLKALEDAAAQR